MEFKVNYKEQDAFILCRVAHLCGTSEGHFFDIHVAGNSRARRTSAIDYVDDASWETGLKNKADNQFSSFPKPKLSTDPKHMTRRKRKLTLDRQQQFGGGSR